MKEERTYSVNRCTSEGVFDGAAEAGAFCWVFRDGHDVGLF